MRDDLDWNGPEHRLAQIEAHVKTLRDAIRAETRTAEELKEHGLIRAGTWMKDGKYLYLVYPSDGCGGRKRKYVGADPLEIRKALAGIQRAGEYDRCQKNLQALNQQLSTVTYHLESALRAAELPRHFYPVKPTGAWCRV